MTEGARKGWHRVKFGDVVRLCDERADPKAMGLARFVGLEHLDGDQLRVRRWGLVADGTTFTNRFKPGQVLFGKRRAYQRKSAVADFEGVCSGDIYVLESSSNRLLPEFLPFVCQTDAFFACAVETSAGSLSPRTNWSSLSKFELVLPSPEEQQQLSIKLTAIDGVSSATLSLRDALVDAREALTEQYATAFGAPLDTTGTVRADSIPEGWNLFSIRELCTGEGAGLTLGPFGSDLTVADYGSLTEGTPVLFVADVQRYRLTHESNRFISPEKHRDLAVHEAVPGDVLITEMGWPPGEACVVPDGWPKSIVKADIIRARVNKRLVHAGYLAGCMNSYWGQRKIARISPGTTRPRMTLRDFEAIRLAVPPLEVQALVVEQVLSLNAGIDAAQQRLSSVASLKRSAL